MSGLGKEATGMFGLSVLLAQLLDQFQGNWTNSIAENLKSAPVVYSFTGCKFFSLQLGGSWLSS